MNGRWEASPARYSLCGELSVAPAAAHGPKRALSQSDTTASTAVPLLSECVPGMTTTVGCGPGGGIPNRSRSPTAPQTGEWVRYVPLAQLRPAFAGARRVLK